MDHKDTQEKKFFVLKDIIIPLIGVLIAFVGLYASLSADKRQELAAQSDREQKYLEFFLQNYSDPSSTKQETAFLLLKYVNSDIRKDLIYSLSNNTRLSPEAFKTILSYHSRLNFGIANKYAIKLLYLSQFKNRAYKLKAQLDSAGFKGTTQLIQKDSLYFYGLGWNNINTVRYNPTYDSIAMNYLYRFINYKNPDLKFVSKAVPDKTKPDTIGVLLHTK